MTEAEAYQLADEGRIRIGGRGELTLRGDSCAALGATLRDGMSRISSGLGIEYPRLPEGRRIEITEMQP